VRHGKPGDCVNVNSSNEVTWRLRKIWRVGRLRGEEIRLSVKTLSFVVGVGEPAACRHCRYRHQCCLARGRQGRSSPRSFVGLIVYNNIAGCPFTDSVPSSPASALSQLLVFGADVPHLPSLASLAFGAVTSPELLRWQHIVISPALLSLRLVDNNFTSVAVADADALFFAIGVVMLPILPVSSSGLLLLSIATPPFPRP
jgi:hypothetical protein